VRVENRKYIAKPTGCRHLGPDAQLTCMSSWATDADLIDAICELVVGPDDPSATMPVRTRLLRLYNSLLEVNSFSADLAAGNLRGAIDLKGPLPQALSNLQVSLKHVGRHATRIGAGDFSPGAHFLGDISDAIHHMMHQLRATHERLHDEAVRDSLTGMYNRRGFSQHWEAECARADREGKPLALVVADIDEFKRINDGWGHAVGDLVIRTFAESVASATRESDIACRSGGDEFLVALWDSDLDAATLAADRIRMTFETSGRSEDLAGCSPTVSIGVAGYPQHGRSLDEIVGSADRALYRAKSRGRNMIAVTS